jgi:hypothetical protein
MLAPVSNNSYNNSYAHNNYIIVLSEFCNNSVIILSLSSYSHNHSHNIHIHSNNDTDYNNGTNRTMHTNPRQYVRIYLWTS